jgi:hypothetical protein
MIQGNSLNNRERDLRKAAEECSELATILIQQLNKPHKDFSKHIIEEMGDALFRLENLRKHFDFQEVVDRIELKRQKYNERSK